MPRSRGQVSVVGVTEAAGNRSVRWRTFGERIVYENPEIRVDQVDAELPDGERIWRWVARLHRTASMVLTDEQDRVLLLWRHRFVQDRWGWELPGGFVDDDEQPAEAATRELEEQTGYRAGEVGQLVSFQPAVDVVDGEHTVFVGQAPEQLGDPISLEGIDRAEWVRLESVPGLIASGEIWTSATMVGLLQVLTQR